MAAITKSSAPRRRSGLRVGIVVAQNFTLSAFALFVDHIRLAADEGDGSRQRDATWSVLASGGEAKSSCGVSIRATALFVDPTNFDYIVVVGGLLRSTDPVGEDAADFIVRAARAGVTLVGLCTGPFILCRLGLMSGRRCCVSWYHHQDFIEEFPDHRLVADRLFVDDGDRITCAGGAGTADLAAYLVSRHLGRSAAQKASQVLMFDRPRLGEESQPHPPIAADNATGKIARALLLMEQNVADPISIERLAGELSISKRQFERLFQTSVGMAPAAAYRDIRLRYASWLLAHTDRSVTYIAQEAGFADCAHFSRLYKARYGESPTKLRQHRPSPAPGDQIAGPRIYSA